MDPFQNVIYMFQEITKFRIVLQTNKLSTIENTTTSLTAPSRSKAIV